MNKKLVIFISTFCFVSLAEANCGLVPAQPGLLSKPVISGSELIELEGQIDAYLANIDFYQSCIDGRASAVDVEIDNYETIYQDWMLLREAAEEQKAFAIQRYNNHIKTAQPDPIEEETKSSSN